MLSAESLRKRAARADKKANLKKREERLAQTQANRPHVVLGTRPGEDHKWTNCDLARCVLTEEQILASNEPPLAVHGPIGDVALPKHVNYGVTKEDAQLLFGTLPALVRESTGDRSVREQDIGWQSSPEQLEKMTQEATEKERTKAEMLARVIDLRNANAGGIAYENRRRIVEAFSEPGKPGDVGRTEVQGALFSDLLFTPAEQLCLCPVVAIMTLRIRTLWSHLTRHKKDVMNRLSLRKLIHHRARMLKYLKRTDADRYEILLSRIGVEPGAVEGELIV